MRLVGLLLFALVLLASPIAHAGDEPDSADGKAYFSDGTAAFQRGEYAAASRAFAAGYEVEKWSGFLFAWAQSERVAGNCTKAVELYSKFIWTKPADDIRAHALGWIKQCNGTYQEPPPEPPKDPVKPPEPPKPPKDPVKPPEPPKPAADRFPHKLAIGLGVVSIASAVVAIRYDLQARDDFRVANKATDYELVDRARTRGEHRLLVAQISGGLAIGLATAAVVRFVVHRPSKLEVIATPTGIAAKTRF